MGWAKCGTCNGTGQADGKRCGTCSGSGIVST